MRQVVVSRRGGPEVLEVHQAPVPTVGREQIRIRVATAGVIKPVIDRILPLEEAAAAHRLKIVLQTPHGAPR